MTRGLTFFLLGAYAAYAQGPTVGAVEIFGAHKLSKDKIRGALGLSEGGQLAGSKADIEERLEAIDGIVRASVEAVCCVEKKAILYVGIEERGAPRFEVRPPPSKPLVLPEAIMQTWDEFTTAIAAAVRKGTAEEDLTQGHSLMKDADVRAIQQKFTGIAKVNEDLLKDILRNAEDEQHRGVAAYILGYLPDKKAAGEELQYAMTDADPTVRVNAMRGLMAIAVLARLKPELGIRVSPTWFIEMLNSTNFSDRLKAAEALFHFTEKRDELVIRHLKERAIPALTEMSAWADGGHAVPAFILLGRAAGLPETEIQDLWSKGDRLTLLKKVAESEKKR